MKFSIEFECPFCGSTDGIVARVKEIRYRSLNCVHQLFRGGPAAVQMNSDTLSSSPDEGREIEAFECWKCEEVIATTEKELIDWLTENNMLTEVSKCHEL